MKKPTKTDHEGRTINKAFITSLDEYMVMCRYVCVSIHMFQKLLYKHRELILEVKCDQAPGQKVKQ